MTRPTSKAFGHSASAFGLIDQASAENAEIPALVMEMPIATSIGRTYTYATMVSGASQEEIELTHGAIRTLWGNPDFHDEIRTILARYAENERLVGKLMSGEYDASNVYDVYNDARTVLANVFKDLAQLDHRGAKLLDTNFEAIRTMLDSESGKLITSKRVYNPLHRPIQGTRPMRPHLTFAGKRGGIKGAVAALAFGAGGVAMGSGEIIFVSMMGLGANFEVRATRHMSHKEQFVDPLAQQLAASSDFTGSISAIAYLDMIQGFAQLGRISEYDVCLPEVVDTPNHSFRAEDLRNPLLCVRGALAVPNDLLLEKLTFVSGPNSGGKSTLFKTVAPSQLLAQAGGPIFARSATISRADLILYVVPDPPDLASSGGRLRSELETVKDGFERATSRSLLSLDDIFEGTRVAERAEIFDNVCEGFHLLGSNTLVLTHSDDVLNGFRARGIGQFLQVDFANKTPTYRLKPGISTTSHAREVAKEVGMDRDSIMNSLTNRGLAVNETAALEL